jgi:diadenosine tetraphosphate (Ap4A) HIT family hydrolase
LTDNTLYSNQYIRIEIEPFEIPWLKVFSVDKLKEFSDCKTEIKLEILKALDIIELEMISYFKPAKINISSFGNYVPQVHFHIQARFQEDSYFPEPTWGKKQRDMNFEIKDVDVFYKRIKELLKEAE